MSPSSRGPARTPHHNRHTWSQLGLICSLIIPEALQGNVLSPFMPFLVTRFWRLPARDTATYVGLLAGAFFLAQALTTPFWGYLSDRIGRRPVILISLLGCALGAIVFATAQTFAVAIGARLFVGCFDAHLAITKTYITEASDSSTVASGFALLSVCWGIGQAIAPLVGGFLADPAAMYPGSAWARAPFLAAFPFALPSILSCCFSLVALGVAYVWLHETEAFSSAKNNGPDNSRCDAGPENDALARCEVVADPTPVAPSVAPLSPLSMQSVMSVRELCSTPAITNVVLCYVLMSAFQVVFDSMTPVLLQLHPADGGLGYGSAAIGLSQLWAGATPIAAQITFVPRYVRMYGSLRCYRAAMALSLGFAVLPLVASLAALGAPPWLVFSLLSALQIARAAVTALAFTACNVLLGESGQGRGLGLINGAAMSAGALTRAVVPALAGVIFSASLGWGLLGGLRLCTTFVLGAAAAAAGAMLASRLPLWMHGPRDAPTSPAPISDSGNLGGHEEARPWREGSVGRKGAAVGLVDESSALAFSAAGVAVPLLPPPSLGVDGAVTRAGRLSRMPPPGSAAASQAWKTLTLGTGH